MIELDNQNTNRRRRIFSCLLLLAAIVVITLLYLVVRQQNWWHRQIANNQPGFYGVVDFDDGDTIKVDMNGRSETIRFIGVDTPETHDPRKAVQCFGYAASDYTKELIGRQKVRLDADPLGTNRDRYNRLLRYVYLPDGRLVNAELIKEGYGFAYVSFPFEKSAEFAGYQEAARAAGKGLWSSCQPRQNEYGGYTSNDAQ